MPHNSHYSGFDGGTGGGSGGGTSAAPSVVYAALDVANYPLGITGTPGATERRRSGIPTGRITIDDSIGATGQIIVSRPLNLGGVSYNGINLSAGVWHISVKSLSDHSATGTDRRAVNIDVLTRNGVVSATNSPLASVTGLYLRGGAINLGFDGSLVFRLTSQMDIFISIYAGQDEPSTSKTPGLTGVNYRVVKINGASGPAGAPGADGAPGPAGPSFDPTSINTRIAAAEALIATNTSSITAGNTARGQLTSRIQNNERGVSDLDGRLSQTNLKTISPSQSGKVLTANDRGGAGWINPIVSGYAPEPNVSRHAFIGGQDFLAAGLTSIDGTTIGEMSDHDDLSVNADGIIDRVTRTISGTTHQGWNAPAGSYVVSLSCKLTNTQLARIQSLSAIAYTKTSTGTENTLYSARNIDVEGGGIDAAFVVNLKAQDDIYFSLRHNLQPSQSVTANTRIASGELCLLYTSPSPRDS